jgi:hypothetical protein
MDKYKTIAMRRTVVLLTKYFFEVDSKFYAFLPRLALERKEWDAFGHWRKLEEIACNNQLNNTGASEYEIVGELSG